MTPQNVDRIIYGIIHLSRVHQEITGSAKAGIMLSQACFYQDTHGRKTADGFWYKTREAWECEAGITKDEFYPARDKCSLFLEMERRGSPSQMWYKVKTQAIDEAITVLKSNLLKECKATGGVSEKPTSNVVDPDIGYVGKADIGMSEIPTAYIEQGSKTIDLKRGTRAREDALASPKASDGAIALMKAFREKFAWYPKRLDPKRTARELRAAEWILGSATSEEVFRLVEAVLRGTFKGNRRKVATLKDLWENFAALRAEFSEGTWISEPEYVNECSEEREIVEFPPLDQPQIPIIRGSGGSGGRKLPSEASDAS